jgi:hypothetical protein
MTSGLEVGRLQSSGVEVAMPTAAFLNKPSPTYIDDWFEMCNARRYRFWGDLTEALQTAKP